MKREEQAREGGAQGPRSGRRDSGLPQNLDPLVRRLHLATIRRVHREVIARAEKEQWSYHDFLALLIAEEVAHRQETRLQRFSRKAHFPYLKTIDDFDFTLQSTVRLSLLGSALSPDFVTEGHNLVLSGKSGRGKTHLAVAIAYRAIQNGFEAFFTTAAALIDDLSRASRAGNLGEALTRYTHPHVLVIDEVGYLTYGTDAANVLFHVVNDRHIRRRSMIFTTNKALSAWGCTTRTLPVRSWIAFSSEDAFSNSMGRQCGRSTSGLTIQGQPSQLSQVARVSGTHIQIAGHSSCTEAPFLRSKAHFRVRAARCVAGIEDPEWEVVRETPIAVHGLVDSREISAGASHTCAVRKTGRVVCWGGNYGGQIGDGTTATALEPVEVALP